MREAGKHRGRRQAQMWFQGESSLSLIAQGALEHKLHQRGCFIPRQEDRDVYPPCSQSLATGYSSPKHRKSSQGESWYKPLAVITCNTWGRGTGLGKGDSYETPTAAAMTDLLLKVFHSSSLSSDKSFSSLLCHLSPSGMLHLLSSFFIFIFHWRIP